MQHQQQDGHPPDALLSPHAPDAGGDAGHVPEAANQAGSIAAAACGGDQPGLEEPTHGGPEETAAVMEKVGMAGAADLARAREDRLLRLWQGLGEPAGSCPTGPVPADSLGLLLPGSEEALAPEEADRPSEGASASQVGPAEPSTAPLSEALPATVHHRCGSRPVLRSSTRTAAAQARAAPAAVSRRLAAGGQAMAAAAAAAAPTVAATAVEGDHNAPTAAEARDGAAVQDAGVEAEDQPSTAQACKLPMSRSLLVGFLGAAMPHRLPKAGLDVGVKISVSGVLLQEDALQAKVFRCKHNNYQLVYLVIEGAAGLMEEHSSVPRTRTFTCLRRGPGTPLLQMDLTPSVDAQGGFRLARLRLVSLLGSEPQLPMDAVLRIGARGDLQEEEHKIRVYSYGGSSDAAAVRLVGPGLEVLALRDNRRAFSLVSAGPPPVLRLDLMPLSVSQRRLSITRGLLVDLLCGEVPALPANAVIRICVNGVQQDEQQIKLLAHGNLRVDLHMADPSLVQACNPRQRRYSLVSNGAVPVLQVDLVPRVEGKKRSRKRKAPTERQQDKDTRGSDSSRGRDSKKAGSKEGASGSNSASAASSSSSSEVDGDSDGSSSSSSSSSSSGSDKANSCLDGGAEAGGSHPLAAQGSTRSRRLTLVRGAGPLRGGRTASKGKAMSPPATTATTTGHSTGGSGVGRATPALRGGRGGAPTRFGSLALLVRAGLQSDKPVERKVQASPARSRAGSALACKQPGTTALEAAGTGPAKADQPHNERELRGRRRAAQSSAAAAAVPETGSGLKPEQQADVADVPGTSSGIGQRPGSEEPRQALGAKAAAAAGSGPRSVGVVRAGHGTLQAIAPPSGHGSQPSDAHEQQQLSPASPGDKRPGSSGTAVMPAQAEGCKRLRCDPSSADVPATSGEEGARLPTCSASLAAEGDIVQPPQQLLLTGGTAGQMEAAAGSGSAGPIQVWLPAGSGPGSARSWSVQEVANWLQCIGEQRLIGSFAAQEVEGEALHGLHLLGFEGMRVQLGRMCGLVPLGTELKLWSRLQELFQSTG